MLKRLGMAAIAVLFVLISLEASASSAPNTLTPLEKVTGWKLLFDGKTLDGWKATGKTEGFIVEDGTIKNIVKGGDYLATDDTYGNFALSIEFKVSKGANSGIFFRWANLKDPVQTGIELQILDSGALAHPGKNDCGAIYDCLAPSSNAMKPAGEWNEVVLTCLNDLIFVDMNGKRIISMGLNQWTTAHKNPDGSENKFNTAYKDMPRVGHIGLQDHGAPVWYRNIKIKELKN